MLSERYSLHVVNLPSEKLSEITYLLSSLSAEHGRVYATSLALASSTLHDVNEIVVVKDLVPLSEILDSGRQTVPAILFIPLQKASV